MTGQEFLESKDIWHHPLVSDRMNVKIYEVSDLLDEFLALQTKPNSINTVLCGEGHNEAVIINGDNTITNDQSQTTTLTAPNELLQGEAMAQNVRADFRNCYIRTKIGCHCTDKCGYDETLRGISDEEVLL